MNREDGTRSYFLQKYYLKIEILKPETSNEKKMLQNCQPEPMPLKSSSWNQFNFKIRTCEILAKLQRKSQYSGGSEQ